MRPKARTQASTFARGRDAEAVGEDHLRAAGYRIEARNFRWRGGEVDRIAWDREVLCFVEIRSRKGTSSVRPEETVGFGKRRRIVRAAEAWLGLRRGPLPKVRFDVLAIEGVGTPHPAIRLLKDAFREGE